MSTDRPLIGIALMLAFCALAPLGDAMAKILGETVPLLILVATRFALQALFLLPAVALAPHRAIMPSRVLMFTALRTVFHVAGLGMMFLALRYLPLADAVAIAFVMPFLLLLAGWLLLGEEVGPRRLAACAVGFAGTLMVVQPSFAEVGPPALLPLGVAVVFAAFMLVTRVIARAVDPVAMQCVSGGMALVVLLPAVAIWSPDLSPVAAEWPMLLLLGLLGTFAHLVMTWSLRFAPTSTLAPMQYLEIPFAALAGYAIFGDFPDGLALAGIAVTMSAGLYIVLRERAVSRQAPVPPTPAPPAA